VWIVDCRCNETNELLTTYRTPDEFKMKIICTLVPFLILLATMAEGRSLYQGIPPGDAVVVRDEHSLNNLAKVNSDTIRYSSNEARAIVTEGLERYHTAPPSDVVIFHNQESLSDLVKNNLDTLLYPGNGGYYLKDMDEVVIGIASDDLCEHFDASFAFVGNTDKADVTKECLKEKGTGKCPTTSSCPPGTEVCGGPHGCCASPLRPDGTSNCLGSHCTSSGDCQNSFCVTWASNSKRCVV
jgi:hypothetical protein